MQRQTVTFVGRVQGVGFRQTVLGLAERHPVTGFVQNLSDGRVRLVAEGSAPELDSLVAQVRTRMASFITNVTVAATPASGEFDGFEIRRTAE